MQDDWKSANTFKNNSTRPAASQPSIGDYKHDAHCMLSVQAFKLKIAKDEFKGGFNSDKLFYQSLWWLNKENFGHARLMREIADSWLSCKFEHAGCRFTMNAPELSPEDVDAIPGARASLNQLDGLEFEVLERSGSQMVIRQDEVKFWQSQGGEISDTFKMLKDKHMELLNRQTGILAAAQPEAGHGTTPSLAASADGGEACVTVESLAKLEELHGVAVKVASEVSAVEILVGKDESLWLLSSADKHVAKHVQLGGFGTGQYVPDQNGAEGLSFNMPSGDATIVQLDEASFAPEATGTSTLSLFKLLLKAEKDKGLTEHQFSFLKVVRKQDVLEAGTDGLEISVKTPMKFKPLKDPRANDSEERVTCKNVFARALPALHASASIQKVFRWRYEKVGQNFKIQRPYVITSKGLRLEKGKPLKI